MHIVLFRHAEREPMRATNPPLTAQGMRQAQALALLVKQGGLPAPTRLLVSPKLRTQQTFTPLSDSLGLDFALCPDPD
jgi:phosphohistidine phosphatase SixA